MEYAPAKITDRHELPVPPIRILDMIPDFVGVADRDGRLLYMNPAGRRMVGLGSDDPVGGFKIHDFFPNWTVDSLESAGSGNGNGNGAAERWVDWSARGRLRRRDGREIPATHAVVAHADEHSEIACFTVIARGAFYPTEHSTAAQPVKITDVVSESLAMARTSMSASVTIREALNSNGAAVLADPTQIHQMVMNLCLNSAQSMREGGGEIFVSTTRVSVNGPHEPGGTALRAGNYVRLTIRDNGPGLQPTVATHIFEPVLAETSYEEATTLSGLWNVKRSVVDSGGDIFVETAPGRGTAFHVYLPILGSNGNG